MVGITLKLLYLPLPRSIDEVYHEERQREHTLDDEMDLSKQRKRNFYIDLFAWLYAQPGAQLCEPRTAWEKLYRRRTQRSRAGPALHS